MGLFYYIMAHRLPEQVARLAGSLQGKHNEVHLHLDADVDLEKYKRHFSSTHVNWVSRRKAVHWGGYSQVRCILEGLKLFLASNRSHFVLLSGQDLPVKPLNELKGLLEKDSEACYIQIDTFEKNWGTKNSRLDAYYFVDFWSGSRKRMPAFTWSLNKLEGLVNKSQRLFINRKQPRKFKLYGGSCWFILSRPVVLKMMAYLEQNSSFARFFRTTVSADEMFFHSLIASLDLLHLCKPSLTYARFRNGSRNPDILTMSDLEDLQRQNYFFARKFDSGVDEEIVNHLTSKSRL